ncbi:MAG: hypothetical protein ACREBD_03875 [Blastocatellia bacterium]
MSDFLTNLAERNLDRATAIRPRAALPFEDAGRLDAARAFQSDRQPPSIAGWASPPDSDFEPHQFAVEEAMVEVPARGGAERKTPPAGERSERETGRQPDQDAIRAAGGETMIGFSARDAAGKSASPNFANEASAGEMIERERGREQEQSMVHPREFEITLEAPVFSHQRSSSSALSKRLPHEQLNEEDSFTAAPRVAPAPAPDGSAGPSLTPQASISRLSDLPDDWLRRVFEKSTQNGFGIENGRGASPGIADQPEDRSLSAEIDFVEKEQSPGQSRSLVASDSESVNGFVLRPAWTVKPIITRRDIARSGARAALNDSQTAGAAQPEQVIQVTIGRIEVRATAPPAQAKNEGRPAAPPMMSLDDYLQQRSRMGSTGGGR